MAIERKYQKKDNAWWQDREVKTLKDNMFFDVLIPAGTVGTVDERSANPSEGVEVKMI